MNHLNIKNTVQDIFHLKNIALPLTLLIIFSLNTVLFLKDSKVIYSNNGQKG
jgi:hypothetical protein